MTHHFQSSTTHEAVQLLAEHGFEAMVQAIQVLMNVAMRIERAHYLQAAPYERSEGRRSHANGFKPKTVNSRLGKLQLQVPQTRDSQFYPSTLERGERSERALKLALAEMYVQGVSTRKVAAITQELCGLEVSSAQVSRAAKLLDEELEAWRNRQLGQVQYLVLDARYEKVRIDGTVRDCAVLVAIGILPDGQPKLKLANMTVYTYFREIAKLGGFLARKGDGEPGWQTVWRGYQTLQSLLDGMRLVGAV
jgi:putative transposase